jgi:outer membrane protein assembly complex protein YaeT
MTRHSQFTIRHANRAWWRVTVCLPFALCLLTYSASAEAQVGERILEVVIEQEGQPVTDPLVLSLIETVVGEPLSMRDVRETEEHLYNLQRFDDIQPRAEVVPGGVRVRYVLFPSHPVDVLDFRGTLGLSERDLRRVITDRFGRTPAAARKDEVAERLTLAYRQRGYPAAQVVARIEETHDPDRATMILDIMAGRRARIADVRVTQVDERDTGALIGVPDIERGAPYDADEINEQLREWEERLRSQGYYEARASFAAQMDEDAYVFVNVARGPRVVVLFTGDPLPEDEQERLVPVRAEGSADEDLLEDAKLAIERYWQERGYRDAVASPTRNDKTPGELQITFDIRRGPRYIVDAVRITGNSAFSMQELEAILQIVPGDLFIRSRLSARVGGIRGAYQTRGYTRAQVQAREAVLPSAASGGSDRRVEIVIDIMEGPRTLVRSIAFEGNTVLGEPALRSLVASTPGQPFSPGDVIAGQDRIDLEYRNLGYGTVDVRQTVTFSDDETQADIRYTIVEGPQFIVDHIIVIGNTRTSLETINDELTFREGGPAGYTALIESRARLAALGLFRRVDIEEIQHTGEARRDVLVRIEEGDPTTFDFSGGLELSVRGRRGDDDVIEDRIELVPRGAIGIGRRNLWGKNRSVNLFTRVALKSTDRLVDEGGVPLEETETNRGFNEFRVVGTFREPRLFSTRAELLITGIVEQAVRTSFNFARRIVRAEIGWPVTPAISVAGRYSFERNKRFDEVLRPGENPILIDQHFPQVRISKFAGSFIRETRDDLLDASRGVSLIADVDLAARAIGSQVGFARTFVQASTYKQLPTTRRIVAAFSGRIGVARGFKRPAPDGSGQEVDDLPASERFFTGGDSSVRGFSLDRVATEDTITATGFPLGGHGVVVVNAELRVTVRGAIQAVGFFDAGGIYRRASDIDLTELRPSLGFGFRYVIRRFGPVRVDYGFNLDRRELVPGTPERGSVLHVSLGQAF